ncbi:MAG: DUF4394 domain-containing protein, partial [Planctomycetes bacterium]|nr:DUF4394 domain-containing protein [Planctomycetota bacterium]
PVPISIVPVNPQVSEIEYGDGLIYLSDVGFRDLLHAINPSTGEFISTTKLTYPDGGNVITALEFAGGTLYGGLATKRNPDVESIFVEIDLATGEVTSRGPTGVDFPLGGLSFDVANSVMYAVSAGSSSGNLYTVDLQTGRLTLVGPTEIPMSALEFGPDGVLYGLPTKDESTYPNYLLRVDTKTGIATPLYRLSGASPLNALTALEAPAPPPQPVPEPSTLVIFGLGCIGLSIYRWRQRG